MIITLKHYEMLPEFYQEIAREEGSKRVVDYISGMTDNFCIATFRKLVVPRSYVQT